MAVKFKTRQIYYGSGFRSLAYLAVVQKSEAKEGGLYYSVLEIIIEVDLKAEKVDYDRITIDEANSSFALVFYKYVNFDETPHGQKSKVMRPVHVEIFPNHTIQTINIDASDNFEEMEASRMYFEKKEAGS